MKLSSPIAVASLSLLTGRIACAADATTPIDYAQRNGPFAPAASITPAKKDLPRDEALPEKRVEPALIEKKSAAMGDRRAAIDVEETRDKKVREKKSSRPEPVEQTLNSFNHRESAIATGADTKKPPTVAKFQDSLTAASASNMARFPALGGATAAKINRFVFRKNPSDDAAVTGRAPAVRAASGSPEVK